MDDSLIPSLKKTAHLVVRNAARPSGTLEQGVFTMFVARSEIERIMGLDQGELGKARWKSMVKELVKAAVDNIDNTTSSSRASSSSYPTTLSSPSPLPSHPSTSKISKSKSRASTSKFINAMKSKRSKSEEGDDYYSDLPKIASKSGTRKQKAKGKKVDNGSESKEEEEEEEVIDNDDSDEGFPSSMPKSTPPKRPSDKKQKRREEQEEEEIETRKTYVEEPQARMSDTDMSSVYDEPPTMKTKSRKSASAPASGKRKSKVKSVSVLSSDEEKPSTKKRKGANCTEKKNKKDPNEGLSPGEAKLADLKRIVVACGVRKQWAKEFADCPTTSSQIRHVQGLLSSLGIKGQPTLGKAKTLKAKRELAQELDDVKTFEAARGLSSITRERRSRASSGTKRKKVIGSDDEEEEEGEEDESIELDKEESALGAVLDLDFLGGDSDSD
ncbi:hypothetical protein L486_08549 [Kwoniella mangroviensis CBS 10435]|uniref:Uncharacterized protein n=1 Tax=Kwoniella mangroviensis CBS 10435 TaxID=1331196 RepID=A0A1B9IF77_9TREE|nr:hypothetical protein L486_08549 [Kwoniella mangroviensis CBS 10435]